METNRPILHLRKLRRTIGPVSRLLTGGVHVTYEPQAGRDAACQARYRGLSAGMEGEIVLMSYTENGESNLQRESREFLQGGLGGLARCRGLFARWLRVVP